MGNIADYIDWRGDLPMSYDPFNNVDNLILSELAYIDYENVLAPFDFSKHPTIREVNQRYWKVHTEEEILARQDSVSKAPFLLKKAGISERYGDIRMTGYMNIVAEDMQSQFAVVTFILEDGSAYVAYRGTDDTLIGWKEDFNMSFLYQTPGQVQAAKYLDDHFLDTNISLRIGGHSKGGNFAVYAGSFCRDEIRNRIIQIYSNDGPGFRSLVTDSGDYQAMKPKIISLVPEDSIIGMLLESDLDDIVVKSSNKGVMSHDALSWQVIRNKFETVPHRSDTSKFYDKTFTQWISSLNPAERREFVDALFESMLATGKTNLSEFNHLSWRDLNDMTNYIKSLPPEKQKNYHHVWAALARSGAGTLMSGIRDAAETGLSKIISASEERIRRKIAEQGARSEDKQKIENQSDTKQKLPDHR